MCLTVEWIHGLFELHVLLFIWASEETLKKENKKPHEHTHTQIDIRAHTQTHVHKMFVHTHMYKKSF